MPDSQTLQEEIIKFPQLAVDRFVIPPINPEDRTGYRPTGRTSYKYVKFTMPSGKIICGLMEGRTEKQVVEDFCDTLKCGYTWVPKKNSIWISEGQIKYLFNYTYEWTFSIYQHLVSDRTYIFPKEKDLYHALYGDQYNIYIYCKCVEDDKEYAIPIKLFRCLSSSENVLDWINSALNKIFTIKIPIRVHIPFGEHTISDKYHHTLEYPGEIIFR